MADHVRKQIRAAVQAALRAGPGVTVPDQNIFNARVFALDPEKGELPAILITTPAEESEIGTMGAPPKLERSLEVLVEVRAEAKDGVDDVLDDVAATIEPVLNNSDLGGLVRNLMIAATEATLVGEADQETGQLKMTFNAWYRTTATDPTTAL